MVSTGIPAMFASAQRSKIEYVPPYYIAGMYSVLGQREQAFEWLGKAYELRDENLMGVRNEPEFDNIRTDSRFVDLLRRMKLTIPTSPSLKEAKAEYTKRQ